MDTDTDIKRYQKQKISTHLFIDIIKKKINNE